MPFAWGVSKVNFADVCSSIGVSYERSRIGRRIIDRVTSSFLRRLASHVNFKRTSWNSRNSVTRKRNDFGCRTATTTTSKICSTVGERATVSQTHPKLQLHQSQDEISTCTNARSTSRQTRLKDCDLYQAMPSARARTNISGKSRGGRRCTRTLSRRDTIRSEILAFAQRNGPAAWPPKMSSVVQACVRLTECP